MVLECGACYRFIQEEWVYCPWCGERTWMSIKREKEGADPIG